MSASEPELFHFGAIVGTHGLKGDLKVRPLSRASNALCDASRVVLRCRKGGERLLDVVRCATHKGNILLRLEEHEHINLVADFVGCDVLMLRSELPEPAGGEHYWQDLQGLEVFDRRYGLLGTLEDVFTTAAHDVYVVQGSFGEVLIPAVDAFICGVDLDGRRMTVDLPEGLVPGSDAN